MMFVNERQPRRELFDLSSDFQINKMGEFADKEVERYCAVEQWGLAFRIRKGILAFALVYFSLIVFDLLFYEQLWNVQFSLICRSVVLVAAVVLFFVMPHLKKMQAMFSCLSGFELGLMASYYAIVYQPGAMGGFTEQGMALMIFIMCFFLTPNRWVYSLVVSVVAVGGFLGLAMYHGTFQDAFVFGKTCMYLVAMIVVCSIYGYRAGKHWHEQFAKEQVLRRANMTDQLTGIYNRIKFDEELTKCWGQEDSRFQKHAVAMMDLDGFKEINDRYGHLVGDRVLKDVARKVYERIRPQDVFARWSGEAFVVLVAEPDKQKAVQFAERLRELIDGMVWDTVGHVSVSIGVTQVQREDNPDSVMLRVDRFMMMAKATGRNKVVDDQSPEVLKAGMNGQKVAPLFT